MQFLQQRVWSNASRVGDLKGGNQVAKRRDGIKVHDPIPQRQAKRDQSIFQPSPKQQTAAPMPMVAAPSPMPMSFTPMSYTPVETHESTPAETHESTPAETHESAPADSPTTPTSTTVKIKGSARDTALLKKRGIDENITTNVKGAKAQIVEGNQGSEIDFTQSGDENKPDTITLQDNTNNITNRYTYRKLTDEEISQNNYGVKADGGSYYILDTVENSDGTIKKSSHAEVYKLNITTDGDGAKNYDLRQEKGMAGSGRTSRFQSQTYEAKPKEDNHVITTDGLSDSIGSQENGGVFTRFPTNYNSNCQFYTDSNGKGMKAVVMIDGVQIESDTFEFDGDMSKLRDVQKQAEKSLEAKLEEFKKQAPVTTQTETGGTTKS